MSESFMIAIDKENGCFNNAFEEISNKIGDIVEVTTEKCKFVAYFMGEREHNGHKYNVVSPYYDEKRLHWLEIDTPLRKVEYETNVHLSA